MRNINIGGMQGTHCLLLSPRQRVPYGALCQPGFDLHKKHRNDQRLTIPTLNVSSNERNLLTSHNTFSTSLNPVAVRLTIPRFSIDSTVLLMADSPLYSEWNFEYCRDIFQVFRRRLTLKYHLDDHTSHGAVPF